MIRGAIKLINGHQHSHGPSYRRAIVHCASILWKHHQKCDKRVLSRVPVQVQYRMARQCRILGLFFIITGNNMNGCHLPPADRPTCHHSVMRCARSCLIFLKVWLLVQTQMLFRNSSQYKNNTERPSSYGNVYSTLI
jgi:hypothetical protein